MLLLLACAPDPDADAPASTPSVLDDLEEVGDAPGSVERTGEDILYADTGVLAFGIELDDAAVAQLAAAPTEYVEGAFVWGDERYAPVGVRLKGNSTYQWLDARPAWKIKFDEYVPGGRFHGVERITLDSNYWDGSMMAETLAYRMWRLSDAPAPRTGYANVTYNGDLKGLYTIVESMDDGFTETWWDGTGALYEMCRTCDFHLDCGQYPLQESGDAYDPDGLERACAAARSADETEIRAHFDWTRLTRYFALERVMNHADSYSYNQNNYYLYHDPGTDQVTLSPWGADSTLSYSYPPDEDRPCEPGYFDNLVSDPGGYLAVWCRGNTSCWADVEAEMLAAADRLESEDFAGFAAATAERIRPSVVADPTWPWGTDTFDTKATCFTTWLTDRPAQIRGFVETH